MAAAQVEPCAIATQLLLRRDFNASMTIDTASTAGKSSHLPIPIQPPVWDNGGGSFVGLFAPVMPVLPAGCYPRLQTCGHRIASVALAGDLGVSGKSVATGGTWPHPRTRSATGCFRGANPTGLLTKQPLRLLLRANCGLVLGASATREKRLVCCSFHRSDFLTRTSSCRIAFRTSSAGVE